MTDTPTIALYYKEHDPMKRKMFLDQSIAAGEDEETNAVRKEIWEIRYGGPSELGPDTRADGYLALWMAMEYSKDAAGRMFGGKRARKEVEKNLARMKFNELQEKSAKKKLQNDIYTTAVAFPEEINMQQELEIITRAAREAYEDHFPGEGGL